ncbi:hypothetical protein [Dyadobacter sp. NIV53]|nr:hypothetical protein [Dyadobacter sp. NIV53]
MSFRKDYPLYLFFEKDNIKEKKEESGHCAGLVLRVGRNLYIPN